MARTATKKKETLDNTLVKKKSAKSKISEVTSVSLEQSDVLTPSAKSNKRVGRPLKKIASSKDLINPVGQAKNKKDLQKKVEQLKNLITELNQKQVLSPNSLISENTTNEMQKLKIDLLDVSNNVFHLQKVVKDANIIIERKMNQLFVKIAFLVIILTLIIAFLLIWLQTNPSD